MERRRKVIIVIILVALAIALYILISTGFFILLYLLLFGTSIAGHDPFFMQKEPNQFYETEISCMDGSGHKVSGTDKYGFGWAGCLFDNCEYDNSIVGDHMRCVRVTMIE